MTPWTAAPQASLSITNSRSLLKVMSIESVMPSNHLILCHPLLLPSSFPSIRVFSNESALRIRWPKCWSFSFSISPSGGGYAPGAQQRAAQARLSFTLRGFFTTWELASRCSPGHREGRSFGKGPGAAVFAATQPSHEEALPVATAPPDPSPLDSGAAVRGVEKARHA